MNGWMGKILRVDLSDGEIGEIDTGKYVPEFIGGYGMALKLMWDELSGKPVPKEFDPEAPLIFSTGPLAGTPAPSSGRTEVACMAPQSYPICWVTDSGFGGDFAMKMKLAGPIALATSTFTMAMSNYWTAHHYGVSTRSRRSSCS